MCSRSFWYPMPPALRPPLILLAASVINSLLYPDSIPLQDSAIYFLIFSSSPSPKLWESVYSVWLHPEVHGNECSKDKPQETVKGDLDTLYKCPSLQVFGWTLLGHILSLEVPLPAVMTLIYLYVDFFSFPLLTHLDLSLLLPGITSQINHLYLNISVSTFGINQRS